ncbi:1-acyl-sn-glycerol-3-phosphate acyltransferase [Chloroflexota bacterium]
MNSTAKIPSEARTISEQLADSFLEQLALAMKLSHTGLVRNLLGILFHKAAMYMAQKSLELDERTRRDGPVQAADWLLQHFAAAHTADGTEKIPESGPLIIAANHPAAFDSLAILAHLNRSDFKIIIGDIPPFHYLPAVCEQAIFAPLKDTHGRMLVIREAVRHLEKNGSLLIFPRGGIEPDPAIMDNPDSEFHLWSRSLEIFLRRVPHTQVLVTIVSGVISRAAMRHPITWLRRARPDRQRLAFLYQFIRQMLAGNEFFGLKTHVSFGEVISNAGQGDVSSRIEQTARRTLRRHLEIIKPSLVQ